MQRLRLRVEQTQPKEGYNGKQNRRFSVRDESGYLTCTESHKGIAYKESIAEDPAGRRATTGIQDKERTETCGRGHFGKFEIRRTDRQAASIPKGNRDLDIGVAGYKDILLLVRVVNIEPRRYARYV